jgi:hypothetical protein
MRATLVAIFALISLHLWAQRECFTAESLKEFSAAHLSFRQSKLSNNDIQQDGTTSITLNEVSLAPAIIRIPVVVHILYNTAAQNVSDDQVKSQIEALNRDFRKRNNDTLNIPPRFRSLAADVEIEFQLAVVNPQNRATTGIIRKQTAVKEWVMDDKIKFSAQGGDDAWDSKSYLNIWVGNVKRTLGYSSPINGPADKDGIVISHSVFGTIGITGAFNMGRTLVHETGHWLGLKHIWGDAPCGDDEVNDTPTQAGFTSGCPSEFRTTCGTSVLGDMYMNFMDFTNDACMYLFTKGQKNKMRANFLAGSFRNSLLNSKGLDSTYIIKTPVVVTPEPAPGSTGSVLKNPSNEALVFPNPANRELTLKLFDGDWIGKEVKIINMNGMILQKLRITSLAHVISVATLKQGLYFIVLEKADKRIFLKFIKTEPTP